MSRFSKSLIFLAASIVVLIPHNAAAIVSPAQDIQKQTSAALWTSSNAQHVYGLPDTKPDDRGTLSLDGEGLSFTGKSAAFSLQWHSIIALSAGSDKVELWGAKGRLLRMLIPFSGGLAVAAITHHRVDELTVEFRGSKGGYHGAVFLLPSGEALRAVESSSRIGLVPNNSGDSECEEQPMQPGTVVLRMSSQPQLHVPAAYRALLYEHLVDRLRRVHGMQVVYREGQETDQGSCPEFVIDVAIAAFRPGNQVVRASTGPIGMFVAPTELTMNATFSDLPHGQSLHRQLKSTVRDDSESTRVSEKAAKSLAKHFASASKKLQKTSLGLSSESSLLHRGVDQ